MSSKVGDLLQRVTVPHLEIATTTAAEQSVRVVVLAEIIQRTNPIFVRVVYGLLALMVGHAPLFDAHVTRATEQVAVEAAQRLHAVVVRRHHVELGHSDTVQQAVHIVARRIIA